MEIKAIAVKYLTALCIVSHCFMKIADNIYVSICKHSRQPIMKHKLFAVHLNILIIIHRPAQLGSTDHLLSKLTVTKVTYSASMLIEALSQPAIVSLQQQRNLHKNNWMPPPVVDLLAGYPQCIVSSKFIPCPCYS